MPCRIASAGCRTRISFPRKISRPAEGASAPKIARSNSVRPDPTSPAIPNAIAGLLLDLRDRTRTIPHAYFGWTEGNPMTYLLKFLAFGEGDTAPVCREVLRQAEPDPKRRPRVHVG